MVVRLADEPLCSDGLANAPTSRCPEESTVSAGHWCSRSIRTLPFDDKRDFDEAKKGFIAEPPYKQIMADAGQVAWDMGSYQWLLQDKDFQSIHPSLQRQAVLNMAMVCTRWYRTRSIRYVDSI